MKKSPHRIPWRKIFLWTVVALLAIPVLEVLAVRFIKPPITPLMLLRRIEGRKTKGPAPSPAYRWVSLDRCPVDFLKGVWMMEDARFFDHDGFDWKEMEIAIEQSKATGKPVRGASTITNQCARSLFLWQGRSWVRKPLEAYYTILMETMLTKRRILELYVNVIETGDGIYGIEAAAQNHYARPASRLSREQCAMLAAILPNPRGWNPRHPSPRMLRRQRIILQRMGQVQELPWKEDM